MSAPTVTAGVDGCKGGWIAVIGEPGKTPRLQVVPRFEILIDMLPGNAVIAVDMPIGLPASVGAGGRGPERAVRPLLARRQSSVFSIPSRAAVYALDYSDACRIALATSNPPRKISRQAFHIFPKIREIDALLCKKTRLSGRIIEAHPELAFRQLNAGEAMAFPKKIKGRVNPAGMTERISLLCKHGYERAFLEGPPPRGAQADDVLDAAAVALVARRYSLGTAQPFPDPFECDAFGLPMAIWG